MAKSVGWESAGWLSPIFGKKPPYINNQLPNLLSQVEKRLALEFLVSFEI
jgi:hypothetical protein